MKYVEIKLLVIWGICNGNNDNIRTRAKFDAGGGAETSFTLTVT